MNAIRNAASLATRLWRTTALWGLLALCLAGAPAQAAEPVERRVDRLEVQDLLQAGKLDALDAKVDNHFVLLNAKIDQNTATLDTKIDQIAAVQNAKIDALTLIVEALSAQVARLEIAMWSGFALLTAINVMLFAFVIHQLHALQQSQQALQQSQQAILMHLAGVQPLPAQQLPKKPQRQAAPKQAARRRMPAVTQRAAL